MFYNQPLATRFGTELITLSNPTIAPYWDTLDIAVAWVRRSGMAYLSEQFRAFLRNGGHLSIVVGIDLKNTTREGLQALLDLEQFGRSETFVYHNEAGSIFHPKVYLFRNTTEARLIVGSNNLTASGLYVNVEAGLQVDARANAAVVRQALDALSTWKDTTSHLAFRLDAEFLAQLDANGYVIDEGAASAQIRDDKTRRAKRNSPPLFGSRRFSPPPTNRPVTTQLAVKNSPAKKAVAPQPVLTPAAQPVPEPPGTTLLMRLRISRKTQTQIPFRLRETFFANAASVRSAQSGEDHDINVATAAGKPNTMKLEVPETAGLKQPMARFERTPDGIVYEVYDLGTPQGNQILAALEEGRKNDSTMMTKSTPDTATWWRFI